MKNKKTIEREVIFNSFNFILFKETIVDEDVPDLIYEKLYVESIRFAEKYNIHIYLCEDKLVEACKKNCQRTMYNVNDCHVMINAYDFNDVASFKNTLKEASNFLKTVKSYIVSSEYKVKTKEEQG